MRLNLGAADVRAGGWWACDVDPWPGLDWVGNVLDGLPLADNTAEVAHAAHVLQMVPWPDLVLWLAEVRRVLKPFGVLRLSVPDLHGAFMALHHDDPAWFPIAEEHEHSTHGRFCLYVSQAGATRSVFTAEWLNELLLRAGFSAVAVTDYRTSILADPSICVLDNRPNESLFMEARK